MTSTEPEETGGGEHKDPHPYPDGTSKMWRGELMIDKRSTALAAAVAASSASSVVAAAAAAVGAPSAASTTVTGDADASASPTKEQPSSSSSSSSTSSATSGLHRIEGTFPSEYVEVIEVDEHVPLAYLLYMPELRALFLEHLQKEFSIENFEFWEEARAFRLSDDATVANKTEFRNK